MNLAAMNIDTFEERLLQIEAAFNNRLWGVSRVFFYVLHCLRLNISPHVRNRDSGFRYRKKIFSCGIRNPGKFSCGIRNP